MKCQMWEGPSKSWVPSFSLIKRESKVQRGAVTYPQLSFIFFFSFVLNAHFNLDSTWIEIYIGRWVTKWYSSRAPKPS